MKKHFDKHDDSSMKSMLVSAVSENRNTGSSTVVMASLDKNMLFTTNLGDSGYLILRPDYKAARKLTTVFKSKEQQYSFNFPY